ncbi:MAG: hypothetical protein ACYCW6_04405 [Candidatus Xenobia bacterium]
MYNMYNPSIPSSSINWGSVSTDGTANAAALSQIQSLLGQAGSYGAPVPDPGNLGSIQALGNSCGQIPDFNFSVSGPFGSSTSESLQAGIFNYSSNSPSGNISESYSNGTLTASDQLCNGESLSETISNGSLSLTETGPDGQTFSESVNNGTETISDATSNGLGYSETLQNGQVQSVTRSDTPIGTSVTDNYQTGQVSGTIGGQAFCYNMGQYMQGFGYQDYGSTNYSGLSQSNPMFNASYSIGAGGAVASLLQMA